MLANFIPKLLSSSGSSVVILFISLLLNKIVALELDSVSYAIYAQILLLTTFLTALYSSGLLQTVLAVGVNKDVVLIYSVIGFMTAFLIVIPFSSFILDYLNIPFSEYLVYTMVVAFIIYQLPVYAQAITIGRSKSVEYFKITVLISVSGLILVIYALYNLTFEWLILVLVVRPILFVVLLALKHVRSFLLALKRIEFNLNAKVYSQALGFYFYGLISIVSGLAISSLLRSSLSNDFGLIEIGYFFSAQRLYELALGMAASFYSTFYYSQLSKLDKKEARKLLLKVSVASITFFSIAGAISVLFSEEIILLLLSENQLGAKEYMPALALNMTIYSLVYASGFYVMLFWKKAFMVISEIIFLVSFYILLLFFEGREVVFSLLILSLLKLMFNYFLLLRYKRI